jgi:hypothetical protein
VFALDHGAEDARTIFQQIPLRTEAGASAAGGAMLHGGSGTVIKAVLKDGTRETIYLTSAE